MINDIKKDAETRMEKSIASLEVAFSKVRTGRAHPSLLDGVMVSYYGSPTPLNQVAGVNVEDGRTLLVQPWEKPLLPDIEKAIMAANLGLNPSSNGEVIRVPLPPLTEETRREYIKVVKGDAENARVAIRAVRRDANSDIKELLKEKEISEDEDKKGHDDVQKITDKFVKKVDELLAAKEEDLLEL